MSNFEDMDKRLREGLHRLGQIMSGKIQMEEQPTMTTDELRAAKHRLESDILDLLDRFQQEAGAGVWVAGINLELMDRIGPPSPIVAAVEVDVRLR